MNTGAPLPLEALHAALEALTRRLDAVDAWIERHDLTHDRLGERQDAALGRLRDQLRDREYDTYRLEDELRRRR